MADTFATLADLNALLGETVDEAAGALLLETATGTVQAVTGQRLVAVVDDTATMLGTAEAWLDLPQRPVTAVESVEVDGETVTDYKVFGSRLWRACGWATCPSEPSTVAVVYSHGYAADAQEMQLARSVVLALAAQAYSNPAGATGYAIDDYREQYAQTADAGPQIPDHVRVALLRAYGRRGGLVKVG